MVGNEDIASLSLSIPSNINNTYIVKCFSKLQGHLLNLYLYFWNLNSLLFIETTVKHYLPFMLMFINASNNTPFYAQGSLYMVWRVHPKCEAHLPYSLSSLSVGLTTLNLTCYCTNHLQSRYLDAKHFLTTKSKLLNTRRTHVMSIHFNYQNCGWGAILWLPSSRLWTLHVGTLAFLVAEYSCWCGLCESNEQLDVNYCFLHSQSHLNGKNIDNISFKLVVLRLYQVHLERNFMETHLGGNQACMGPMGCKAGARSGSEWHCGNVMVSTFGNFEVCLPNAPIDWAKR